MSTITNIPALTKPCLLSSKAVESKYGINERLLRDWRHFNRGPSYIRTGEGKRGNILYRREVIEKWLQDCTVTPQSTV